MRPPALVADRLRLLNAVHLQLEAVRHGSALVDRQQRHPLSSRKGLYPTL
jgi:hypothetical protein